MGLLKSYLELEKKLSEKTEQNPYGKRPDSPENYEIQIKSNYMKNDAEINKALFDLGLTNEQVQGVYDLAAEKIIPAMEELVSVFKMDKDLSELIQFFGGNEQFNVIARQISSWGEKNLNPQVFEALSGNKDGILMMYQMMQNSQEKPVMVRPDTKDVSDTEETLKRLMQDPKYWKHQDPELTKRIENGFKRLYG